jgi:pimeloyl-ACP methyl ester carboxylesterase
MVTSTLLSGISASLVDTPRLKTYVRFAGPADGVPVIFVHGNISTGCFWKETMLALPPAYRAIALDMRGFGQSEAKPIDATRGLRDLADDLHSLVETLNLSRVHLVGWSVGGGVIMQYALDHPHQVASLTLTAPMSPYGFGGTKDEAGTPCWLDYAGSGGGTASPDFVQLLAAGDRSHENNSAPRQIMNLYFFKPPFRATPEREELYLSAVLSAKVGDANYPGNMIASTNWPGVAPGTTGMNNALSPKYCNLGGFAYLTPQPPVLWLRGDSDQIVSDTSLFDFGFLGQLGAIPGWPGAEVYPPQPMVQQIRAVLNAYQSRGGKYKEVVIKNCGHSPHVEQPEVFCRQLIGFLGEQGVEDRE